MKQVIVRGRMGVGDGRKNGKQRISDTHKGQVIMESEYRGEADGHRLVIIDLNSYLPIGSR